MREKKNAPGSAATLTGAGRENNLTGVFPCLNCTTGGIDRQPRFIENLLLYGPENGQTLKDLVHITQWPERAIRKEIEVERRDGAVIISDNAYGYYLTDDPAEAKRFVRSMHHRAAQISQTATAVEKAAGLTRRDSQQFEGQRCIWDGGNSDG